MKHPSLILAAMMLTACTQPPVEAIYKGNNYYGRNSAMQRASYAPASANYTASNKQVRTTVISSSTNSTASVQPVTVAPLESISVKDSAPTPTKTEKHSSLLAPKKETQAMRDAVPVKHNSSSRFIWPADGKIISSFGSKSAGKFNDGINIAAEEGEPIWAAADGTVIYAGSELRGYGNMALLQHENNMVSAYAHAQKLLVKKGDHVQQGQMIGYVGRTGGVNTAQLHFSLREGKLPVNPAGYLPRTMASN